MGECRYCGLEWEASLVRDESYVDTCAWCQALRAAWRLKNLKEILYWSNRYVSVVRAQSIGEVIDIERTS